MSRCTHQDARPSTKLDEWLWCPGCRGFLKKKEVDTVRFAQEAH